MRRFIDQLRAAAFDLDGTLIDTAPDLGSAANMMLTILGGSTLPEDRLRALIGDGVDRFVEKVLTESFGGGAPGAELRSAATSLFGRLYGQRLYLHSRVYPGVPQALWALENARITLCCVTNKESRFALPLLEAAQLREHFALTLCADRAEDRKPNPNLLRAACARLGVAPAEMLYVGDSRTDIDAARAAGCRVVVVDYGYNHGVPLDKARPDGIVGNLTEIGTLRVPPLPARGDTGAVLLQGS